MIDSRSHDTSHLADGPRVHGEKSSQRHLHVNMLFYVFWVARALH